MKAPTSDELTQLTHTIARRMGRYLERQGLVECDTGNSYLSAQTVDDESLAHLQGHAITYRVAVGPHQGRKVFSLKTLPACDPDDPFADTVGKTSGFSLRAGVAPKDRERDKLERLCRNPGSISPVSNGVFAPNSTHRSQVKNSVYPTYSRPGLKPACRISDFRNARANLML